ncbi:MAG: hypothetical protein L0Z50_16690 [Verrucomicrobiales bacterium]|nr:hypothetical protein [Verrucomicrobiales bacterium]
MKMFKSFVALASPASPLLLGTFWAISANAATYDPEADFSVAANPNGTWSYGWTAQLGSAFNFYNEGALGSFGAAPIEYWQRSPQGYPKLFHNPLSGDLTFDNLSFPDGSIDFHPGADGAFSVLRWTAPSAASVSIIGQFMSAEALSWPASTSDVHIQKNAGSFFDGAINGNIGVVLPFSETILVVAGDTIDFAVGWGANHNYGYDNTALSVKISTSVPESSTFALLEGISLVALAAATRILRPTLLFSQP